MLILKMVNIYSKDIDSLPLAKIVLYSHQTGKKYLGSKNSPAIKF